jgi:hypothetical protein
MSDYAHSDRRSRLDHPDWTIESRVMFAACYLLFLVRAAVKRALPWRRAPLFRSTSRESIFSEASTAAGVLVTSSFMGL